MLTWSLIITFQNNGAILALGSLNNDDGEVDENDKKALGLDFHNNFARASPFFVHFFAVNARLRRENV